MSMHTMQRITPVEQTRDTRKQSLLFYLLAGATGPLLVWLSVGLTPSTWGLLFQVIAQFRTLWAQHGIITLWALLLLIVQSLLLLGAWLLLIGIMVRESIRLQAPSRPALPQQALALASTPRLDEQLIIIPPPSVYQAAVPPAPQPVQAPQATHISLMSTQINSSLSPATSQSSSPPAFDPYAVTNIFGQEEQMLFPDLQQQIQRAPQKGTEEKIQSAWPDWQSDDITSDPFAPHEDILRMSLHENPLRETPLAQKQIPQNPQAQLAQEQDDVFVFGNPFEGILPDVFEHDEDLKRSLKKQNGKS